MRLPVCRPPLLCVKPEISRASIRHPDLTATGAGPTLGVGAYARGEVPENLLDPLEREPDLGDEAVEAERDIRQRGHDEQMIVRHWVLRTRPTVVAARCAQMPDARGAGRRCASTRWP